MSWLFDGLPLHPLFVHAAVVAVPAVALVAITAAWIPKVRDWIGIVLPILATAAFIAAFLTGQSGEALAGQVGQTAAVTRTPGSRMSRSQAPFCCSPEPGRNGRGSASSFVPARAASNRG